ncbi:MAG: hypothetical protein AVDCRST_MAG08-2711 [uncultured Acetobacteraceae bacterium]|uniref:Membrane protein with DUF350 domain n=1 Tax=uncultured Acetobacteraceae bacterium TaxID=169975 RepID=A0A6J4ITI0_9PROT|nr:MAG: hypothetical protein AVDCRST_MAG08-2711 [uncultured Acetobacteraceae bacterium]
MTSLAALPGFLSHFLAGLALLGAALMLYARFTPHDEVALVRAGNPAAAVSLGGAVIGFALPIGAAIAQSVNLLDAVAWAVVALGAQLAAFAASARFLLPGWRASMERGETGCAALMAAIAVAVGVLNAACLTP